jgi:hypothetical protein
MFRILYLKSSGDSWFGEVLKKNTEMSELLMGLSVRWSPVLRLACKVLVACFSLVSIATTFAADPIYQSLVSKGLKVAGSKYVSLTAPCLVDGMSAVEQQVAVQALTGEIGMERFMKDSVVSPFIFEIKSAEKLENNADVQRLDFWFVAYGSIDGVLDKKLFDDLSVPVKPSSDGLSDEARKLTPEELTKYSLNEGELADGSRVSFGHLGISLFDKVRLSLVTHAQSFRSSESLVLIGRIQDGIEELPSTWSPITTDDDDKVRLGTAWPYALGAGYAKVTELKFEPRALFIEMHVLYVEPQEWFNGRNLLRSKLPPVIQEGLRKFRRRLAQ